MKCGSTSIHDTSSSLCHACLGTLEQNASLDGKRFPVTSWTELKGSRWSEQFPNRIAIVSCRALGKQIRLNRRCASLCEVHFMISSSQLQHVASAPGQIMPLRC